MRQVFLGVLVVSLFVMPGIAGALDLNDDDLLLYLRFNDDTDDSSKHGNHGEIAGEADFVEGQYGQALAFSESGEVKAPYVPLNDKSFTITMWIKPALAGNSEQCVLSQMQANATNTSLHYRIYTNGTARMGFYSNDLDAPGALVADEWAHIIFWVDAEGGARRIYVNGVQVAEDAGNPSVTYAGNAGDTIVGSWGTSGQRFNGVIDEVQIWDKALNEDEMQQSMGDLTATAVDASGKLPTAWGEIKRSF